MAADRGIFAPIYGQKGEIDNDWNLYLFAFGNDYDKLFKALLKWRN